MKLTFRGWRREVYPHGPHDVLPVSGSEDDGYKAGEAGAPLRWNGPLTALGQLKNLGLTGNFLVEFTFQEEELRSWLKHFVAAEPEAAIRLLGEMQAEAHISLVRKGVPVDQPASETSD